MICQNCLGERWKPYRIGLEYVARVRECVNCGAIQTMKAITPEKSYRIVHNSWARESLDDQLERWRYYDLTLTTGRRRHGWFDDCTRDILQVG